MIIDGRNFSGKTYIMGILNVTDNSFSDGGKYNTEDAALKHAEQMIADGADIIDVGGESTQPGYTPITDTEEAERVAPIIDCIKREFCVPVSVDTYKSYVCECAAQAGADMINDIWGFLYDENMAKTAAKYGMSACLMHNSHDTSYENFTDDVVKSLKKSVDIAKSAGVTEIVTDPGVGFGKTYEQNLEIIRNIDELKKADCPILLGASRKSVIGLTLNLPVTERLEGTIALSVYAALKGCLFVRVHDVKENKRAVDMIRAVMDNTEGV